MSPIASTQIAFIGGERFAVTEGLDEVVGYVDRDASSPEASRLVRLTKEDGTPVFVNTSHILYVRRL
jgi:uncharacterized protein YlzI (FlbEa/FlbD family)